MKGRIISIEYDPNQKVYIWLLHYWHYWNSEKRYILHLKYIMGDTVVYGTKVPIKMKNVPYLSVVWTIDWRNWK